MSEEPPEDNLPEGYGIEELPYITPTQPLQTPPEREENEGEEAARSVSDEITRPLAPPPPASLEMGPARQKSRRTWWIAGGVIGILLLIVASVVIINISRSTPDK